MKSKGEFELVHTMMACWGMKIIDVHNLGIRWRCLVLLLGM